MDNKMNDLTDSDFEELKRRYDHMEEIDGVSAEFTARLVFFTNHCDKLNLNPSKVKAVFDEDGTLDDLEKLERMEFGLHQKILEN